MLFLKWNCCWGRCYSLILQVFFLTENSYLLFNFNDYPNGMVTLFNLLVMGNWQAWMQVWVLSPILVTFTVNLLVHNDVMNHIVVAGLSLFFCDIYLYVPITICPAVQIPMVFYCNFVVKFGYLLVIENQIEWVVSGSICQLVSRITSIYILPN